MELFSNSCPSCNSNTVKHHGRYLTVNSGLRSIFYCPSCDLHYSETSATPIAGLRTPISRIVQIIKARTDGMSLNATARTFSVSKKSVIDWEMRLSDLKPTLLLYSLLHQFLQQIIEGDELYTKVAKNLSPRDSEGWTIVLMERSSRFLWELKCGKRDQKLFNQAMSILVEVIERTGSTNLLTDGERRYGNILFEICHEVINNGKPGRPKKRLKKNVRVRLKNKGSKKGKGRPRKKYQAPVPEHPETEQEIIDSEIHANHVEAFNAALRRKNAGFRRKTNTYAKTIKGLQRTLDVQWLNHNFVNVHFTTKMIPAVKIGILEVGISWEQMLCIRYAL